MDRLTKLDGDIYTHSNLVKSQSKYHIRELNALQKLGAYENTGLTSTEVAELVQAKRDGRLVMLPCKVGDTVYFYGKPCRGKLDYNECEKAFDQKGNINIWCEKDCLEKDIVISRKFGIEDLKNINKTVFLTKAEAQAALDRME